MYDPKLVRWNTYDPMAEKYYGINPYVYCNGDPVNLVDPEGESTYVKYIGDGKYSVIGGNLDDGDLNIYEYYQDENGDYTIPGQSIGLSMTPYSFYSFDLDNGKGGWMEESIINTNDLSGSLFIKKMINEIGLPTKALIHYMDFAQNARRYDFKTKGLDHYRGMPVWNIDNNTVYASARDIGNYVAGYYAGINGFSWELSRQAFDIYQGGKESLSTTAAQYVGFESADRQRPWIKGYSFFYTCSHAPIDLYVFYIELVSKATRYLSGKLSTYF